MAETTGELAWDLRVTYAILVQQHLVRITFYRFEDNFPKWFEALENLWVITQHKILKSEGMGGIKLKGEKIIYTRSQYKQLFDNILRMVNAHKNTYWGKTQDERGRFELRAALSALETWLYKKMDESNMWGGRREVSGLI